MSKNKQHFLQWLALPKLNRVPKTQAELAPLLNHQSETLSRWEINPTHMDQVYQVARAYLASEIPEILHVILESAKSGDIEFIKLVLELTGRYTEGISIRSDTPQVGIERFTAIIKQVSEWQEERLGNGI